MTTSNDNMEVNMEVQAAKIKAQAAQVADLKANQAISPTMASRVKC